MEYDSPLPRFGAYKLTHEKHVIVLEGKEYVTQREDAMGVWNALGEALGVIHA